MSSSSAVDTQEHWPPTICGCAPTSTSPWSTHARSSSSGSGCTNSWQATYDATVDYGTLLGKGVELVVDNATRIDTAARKVELASGGALDYDYVIYAVGSTGATPASVPGAAEFAYPIAELESAQRLKRRRRRAASRRPDHRRRRRADRHRDGIRAGRTGAFRHAGLRRAVGPVAVRAGSPVDRQMAEPARRHGARDDDGRRGAAQCRGASPAGVRCRAGHDLDGGLRRAGVGRCERSAHRRAGQAAHRRDADQRRRPPRRGRRRLPLPRRDSRCG